MFIYLCATLVSASSWTARTYPKEQVDIWTQRLGPVSDVNSEFASLDSVTMDDTESNDVDFDARTRWPGFISDSRDPGMCCGLYAFAAASMATDRLAIHGVATMVVSPQHMISCGTTCRGCKSCSVYETADNLKSIGVISESCFPYVSERGRVPQCPANCQNGSQISPIKPKYVYREFTVKDDVYANGPVVFIMNIFPSFNRYSSGIYYPASTERPMGSEPVVIVGWGTDGDSEYYIVKCFRGVLFGERGYARVRKESKLWAGSGFGVEFEQ
ncbi:putative Gut-specific cysteine proteinase [Blattamonas nauphoetae]|uniref:Gut-specific cysteine proteinase n=1 Tax=Blattamonas nauphoetae TaxID=2049346 RepID=A0ABQ9WRK0_9EUKA|nr:putative Gut-specific cysteine proteinase [Blattamonas nauphoetae]